jgi:nanoRNase/pAp phosphatase (c-di-AMP/oligoRNAs hydrolase)
MNEKKPLNGTVWRENLKIALDIINTTKNFLFSGDIDPDSVGSMLSLALYLNKIDKKVFLILPENLGKNLDYFEKIIKYNSIQVLRNKEQILAVKGEVETVIFCDTANIKLVPHYSMLAENILSNRPKVIEIDHHFGTDSEELTEYGIKLFRKANANTEIIGQILLTYYETYHEGPNPFDQRNIILGLITGMLGDTVGGKVIPFKEDYNYWMGLLKDCLQNITRWRESDEKRTIDHKELKFGDPQQILEYLNRLTDEQEAYFNLLNNRTELKGEIGFLNLFHSTQEDVADTYKPFDSYWFADIQNFLINSVAETSGCAGMVVFEGQNAEEEDCFFIKLRRAVKFSGIDLRTAEEKLKELFGDLYMGGGGHASAASFRIHPLDEKEFLEKIEKVCDFFNASLLSSTNK